MKLLISSLIGFVLSVSVVSVSATPLIEGRVRLGSGESVANAQVRIFDMTALQRGAIAHATTDATGYFALPQAAVGGAGLPQAWTLGQNYPNPFNPATIIPYQVPTASWVRLDVFNVLGQRIATLVDEVRSAGVHTAVWDATDAAGRPVGAGVYFYRLHSAGQPTLTRRMVLVDGQAGQAMARVAPPSVPPTAPAAEGVYGLSITGAGLVTYVDASFGVRSDMASVEVVVDAVAERPRGKALTGGVLGDVNGDGLVSLADALLVMTYVVHGSVELPPAGNLSLGDVNGDGQVALDDALLLVMYVANPADGSLPSGLGGAVSGKGDEWDVGAIRSLTNDGRYSYPSWSPDGQHIAFQSFRGGNGYGDIYVMDSDGANPRRLTNDTMSSYPSWSPDGQHIAFTFHHDGFNSDIYVMDSDGANPRRLTNDTMSSYPSWSPDGQHITFQSFRGGNGYGDIYVMDSDGANPRRLTNDTMSSYPSWSPDGQHIAFTFHHDGFNSDIYVMDSDGANPRRLTNDTMSSYPSWSPDGQHIAFQSQRDGGYGDIYVMDSDGTNPHRLTIHWSNDFYPSWSPDGQHIAFQSQRDRPGGDIYVMELELSPAMVILDPVLRTFIEKELTKNPGEAITKVEMKALEMLNIDLFYDDEASVGGIRSLSGLETSTNLQVLEISNYDRIGSRSSGGISDLSPLANLTQLQRLHLNNNEISDLSPLANLTQLITLDISDNEISDLKPLTNLTQLITLDISDNEISDLSPLANLTQLQRLHLNNNEISDLSPLTNLTQLITLTLNDNEISDLKPLIALTRLKSLSVLNFLSEASVYENIPVLQDRGVNVWFSSSHLFTPRESPFDIELVFLDSFTVKQQQMLRLAAERWTSAIQTELPEYQFSAEPLDCGDHTIRIPYSEQIDDLRIYITKFDGYYKGFSSGYGTPLLVRLSYMPIIGCIGIEQDFATQSYQLWEMGIHEIGHVLGIGTIWDHSGMLRGLNTDAHFAGPQAITAFDQAGGTNYPGAKVPTQPDGKHWSKDILPGEIMGPHFSGALSAITLGALSDLGYSVDFFSADPYVLSPPTAAKPVANAVPFCPLEGLPAPVYVDD